MKRFDLTSTESLKKQVQEEMEKKIIGIRTQCDFFPGYDEVSVLLEDQTVFSCLVENGIQISDWKLLPREVRQ